MRRLTRLYALPLLFGAIIVGLALVSGCATSHAKVVVPTRVDDSVPSLAILVENEGFYDVDVYLAANDAIVRRLGTVTGYTKSRFLVSGRSVAAGEQLAMYARAIGPNQTWRSGAITIFAGLNLRWTLHDYGAEWLIPFPSSAAQ